MLGKYNLYVHAPCLHNLQLSLEQEVVLNWQTQVCLPHLVYYFSKPNDSILKHYVYVLPRKFLYKAKAMRACHKSQHPQFHHLQINQKQTKYLASFSIMDVKNIRLSLLVSYFTNFVCHKNLPFYRSSSSISFMRPVS